MAKLSYKRRKKLPAKSFALSGRRYPIEDKAHARNALARVSQHGNPEEKAEVRRAVHRKYPAIAVSGGARGGASEKRSRKHRGRKISSRKD